MSWSEAEAYAQGIGEHLVTIDDAAEQAWVHSAFASFDSLWIGLSDAVEEGTWVWSSGEPVVYTNWASGEPNNGNSYNWALMASDGLWYDFYASARLWALIEVDTAAAGDPGGAGPRG